MCKLAFSKTNDGTAYELGLNMLRHQENQVAGHSTGISYIDNKGHHLRKAVGKVIHYLEKYPDIPKTDWALCHSRYASIGAINEDNAHPISVYYKEKRIAYFVHNGTFTDYYRYKSYTKEDRVNKTDSAVICDLFSKILEQFGDSHQNRRKAFANIIKLAGNYQNMIMLFDDKHLIFSGSALTYKYEPEDKKFGIMTFGFSTTVKRDRVYSFEDDKLSMYELSPFEITLTPDPEKEKKKKWWQTELDEMEEADMEEYEEDKELSKTNKFNDDIIEVDGKKFKKYMDYKDQKTAQMYGDGLKKKLNTNYRVFKNDNKWTLFIDVEDYDKRNKVK